MDPQLVTFTIPVNSSASQLYGFYNVLQIVLKELQIKICCNCQHITSVTMLPTVYVFDCFFSFVLNQFIKQYINKTCIT